MPHRSLFSLGLAALAAAALMPAARAQTPVPAPIAPSSLDRTQFRANARALGMGGTDLIMFDDASGAAFNPASLAYSGKFSEANTAVGRTNNVHVSKINDLSRGLKDLGNQFNNSSSSLAGVRDAFQKIYSFATDAGANGSGSPASLNANLAPLVGLGFAVGGDKKNRPDVHIGVVGFGSLTAKAELRAYSQATLGTSFPGLGSPSGAETAAYGVLGLTSIAVPIAIRTPVGAFGIAPRYVQASYAGAGFMADETSTRNGFESAGVPNGDISGATYREVHQSKFDVDAGYISPVDPITHIRGAIAVHNLLSPTFRLPRRINSSLGALPPGGDFSFTMKPQIDLGGRKDDGQVTYAAELHNLGNVNGGKRTVHLGVNYAVSRAFSVRGGYDRSRFVAGLGFAFGTTRLDLATGANPQEEVALSLTFGGR